MRRHELTVIEDYGVELYSNIGYKGRIAIALTAGWVTIAIPGNMLTSLFVDRIGRVRFMSVYFTKPPIGSRTADLEPLVIGYIGIICVLIGEVIVLALLETRTSFVLNAVAIFFLFGHIAFFSSCIDASTYIYASEVFPTRVRAVGISLSLSGLFLASLTFTQAATSAFEAIGWKYYLVFIALSLAMVVCLYTFFPETKGLSLESISKLFDEGAVVEGADDKAEVVTMEVV